MTISSASSPRVRRVTRLRLAATEAPWAFARANAPAVSAHWQRRRAQNPAFFNGRVFVQRGLCHHPDAVEATFSLEQFADFLYWRDHGFPDRGTVACCGSALLRSAEGYVVVGRHAASTINGDSVYLPSGFLDARDMTPGGEIDLDASVARELAEETGLAAAELVRQPGYIVSEHGRTSAFVIEYRSLLPARELRAAMLAGLARNAEQELTDIVVVRDAGDLDGLPILDHSRYLLDEVLAGRV